MPFARAHSAAAARSGVAALRALRMVFAGVKVSFFDAAIVMASPVLGLRPWCSARSPTLNRPKPASATSSPALAAAMIAANMFLGHAVLGGDAFDQIGRVHTVSFPLSLSRGSASRMAPCCCLAPHPPDARLRLVAPASQHRSPSHAKRLTPWLRCPSPGEPRVDDDCLAHTTSRCRRDRRLVSVRVMRRGDAHPEAAALDLSPAASPVRLSANPHAKWHRTSSESHRRRVGQRRTRRLARGPAGVEVGWRRFVRWGMIAS